MPRKKSKSERRLQVSYSLPYATIVAVKREAKESGLPASRIVAKSLESVVRRRARRKQASK